MMKTWLVPALVLPLVLMALAAAAAPAAEAPQRGEVLASYDFDSGDLPAGAWQATLVEGRGGRVLAVESTDAARGAGVTLPLPVERMRGCTVLLSAQVRGEGVSDKPQDWNGVKFMTPIVREGGGRDWPQGSVPTGTFDWQRVVWQTQVPQDAKEMRVFLGMERVTGKAWFDDVRVTVRRGPPAAPKPRADGPAFTGHALPRLRGAMVSPNASPDDLRVLGRDWKANLIRWQLFGFKPRFDTGDLADYDRRLAEELKRFDAILPVCREAGLMVVLDLHTGPGHWAGAGRSLFDNAACQKRFVEIWEDLARRYKDEPCIWAYDLLNEPVPEHVSPDLADWQDLAEMAARAVRRIDASRAIIVEPAPWGGPEAIVNLQPLDVPGVVYSVHMYQPHKFTHQGVYDDKAPYAYPGTVDGKAWDSSALEAALAPVIAFQKKHGVHMYLGEFGAIRWAPEGSGHRYLKDCIEIFEKHGWDWSYHAFREWNGWSAEHTSDRADNRPAAQPTDRQRLLMEWFAKNEKPR